MDLADLLRRLGGIPPERVRLHPTPGTATEEDMAEIQEREDRLFELVGGTLQPPGRGPGRGWGAGAAFTFGNRPQEMKQASGIREYFQAGVRLPWIIDPRTRCARCYTSPEAVVQVPEAGHLDGGVVLPGFRVSLKDLFEEAERRGPRA